MRVKDCMCGEVCWVKPDTKISDIAKIMEQNHIGCVPVCDEQNSLVGIITDRDIILRGIACDKDVKNTNASEIMTTNVCTCNQEDDIYDAELKMANNQIRRIPVVDNNKVIGILTFGDLAHYYDEIGENEFCNTVENICECGGQAKNNC
ncbi:MAG: CBS domain-containing protein [Clostridia bacterium]|nr:CBS domain-containing protein [Clostridia bacterium]